MALDNVLTNAGTVNWLGGPVFLNCSLGDPGPIVNLAGGLWNIQCDQTLSYGCSVPSAYFTNAGTVAKSTYSGTATTISIPFYNSGTLDVGPGTVLMQSSFTDVLRRPFAILGWVNRWQWLRADSIFLRAGFCRGSQRPRDRRIPADAGRGFRRRVHLSVGYRGVLIHQPEFG